jgi:hypothetical protein
MTRTLRIIIVGLLALGAFLVPGAAAYALWSNTATATLTGVTTAAAPAAPGAPTGLSCTGTTTKVLSWSAGPGGTPSSYTVYRDNGNTVGTTATTSLTITESMMGTPPGPMQKYNVNVKATNVSGTSAASANLMVNMKPNQAC